METKSQIVPVSRIESALREANITEHILQTYEAYLSLTVAGPDDEAGYYQARKARMQCRDLRVLATKVAKAGREEAIAEQKAWIAEERRVVGRIEKIEEHLSAQEDVVDGPKAAEADRVAAEKQRLADEAEAKRLARIKFRYEALAAVGVFKSASEVEAMPDSEFDAALRRAAEAHSLAEKKKRDEDAARAEEQKNLDARRAEQDRIDAMQRAEQKKIADERHALEVEKARAESAEKARTAERDRAEREKKEAEEKAKAEAERIEAARKAAEAEDARLEALKPDVEKLKGYAQFIVRVEPPDVTTAEAMKRLTDFNVALHAALTALTK